jgi:hypothetical protein
MRKLFDISKTLPVVTTYPQADIAIYHCDFASTVIMPLNSKECQSLLALYDTEGDLSNEYEQISKEISLIYIQDGMYHLVQEQHANIAVVNDGLFCLAE